MEVGGEDASVDWICPPGRDPHYLEAKPSYMLKAAKADLVLSVGLELETGWLPPILRGARNPKVMPGAPGYLEAGSLIRLLGLNPGATRAEGDVHPLGNPHFMVDPLRAAEVAEGLGKRLGELDAGHAPAFAGRASKLAARLRAEEKDWQARVKAAAPGPLLTEHRSFTYFLDRFHLETLGELEPKPGIPPTASHLVAMAGKARGMRAKLVLVEDFFDRAGADKLASSVEGLRVAVVKVAPEKPAPGAYDEVIEGLVKAVEGKP
jgi:zinc/manganese transport system substrate-binding protein